MNGRKARIIGYTRISSNMQREESCEDQERNIRAYCEQKGIDTSRLEFMRDVAESGTKADRTAFSELREMIARGEVEMLIVDDLSRLTRSTDLPGLKQDIEYHGGALIAVSDHIDSRDANSDLSIHVKGMMNANTIRQIGHQVRRGQRGRVEDDGSAGDFPYGYRSYLIDPAAVWNGRGPKPKKGIQIHPEEAEVVRWVFKRYGDDFASVAQITRELNARAVPKGVRCTKHGWHHEIVGRMLDNEKYEGLWKWGKTTTRRDSKGRTKQTPVSPGDVVVRNRPALRIIDDALWKRVRARRLAQKVAYASPLRPHPRQEYPKRLLSGLLKCGLCGGSMTIGRAGSRISYGCVNHGQGRGCTALNRVPAEHAESEVLQALSGALRSSTEWTQCIAEAAAAEFHFARKAWPTELKSIEQQLAETEVSLENLIKVAMQATGSRMLADRILETERRQQELVQRRAQLHQCSEDALEPPTASWIASQLEGLASLLQSDGGQMRHLIRELVGPVTAFPVVARGKRRGYMRLEFAVTASALLSELQRSHSGFSEIEGKIHERLACETSPTRLIRIELGEPTAPDRIASEIVRLRSQGVAWKEIAGHFGIRTGNAYTIWKRWTDAQVN